MDQKSTVFGVPWHGSKTTILHDSSHGPKAKRQKNAQNGSGMDENQHNLITLAQNFNASPAVTTGMPQDHYLFFKTVRNGPKRSGRRHGLVWGPFGVHCWGH